ncbi:hypothetical protein B0T17DRAFT_513047 [Bombardia bombarda]|uniref:MutL C-terminal dimerisation domain-containing protein n=1 Tax=Bombardia bombarda TaxID=252184 RepID=A0AA39XJB8_9PEZI|nr:hypothetical protein B0T17DRAFT_513047 [Bombardia bombarda]
MSIQPLPGDVVAQIKSSATITSLNGVIAGLLQNSLDAGASQVNISVDYSRGNCSVEDNGLGIPPANFRDNGGLGELHCTSRYPPRADCHGRHGEFLACLGALSLLSIASHHREYRSHNSLTIHNSKVLARNVPALPDQQVLAFTSGTRVTVRDLFGLMPVRVKHRAAEIERQGSTKSFEQLLLTIVAFLLSWPGEVCLSVRDSSTHRAVLVRNPAVGHQNGTQKSTAYAILSRTPKLLEQASLIEREDSKSWVPVGASASGVSVSGCVCLLPVATKRVQFMALGIQPILNENNSNILYEEINRIFANSSFGTVEEVGLGDDGAPKTEGFTARELKAKRGVDRWPMFFLQIRLEEGMSSLNADEFLDDRAHDITIITDLLQLVAYEFLKKHHFRPKAVNAFGRLKPSSKGVSTTRASHPDAVRTSPFSGSESSRAKSKSAPKSAIREPRSSSKRSSRGQTATDRSQSASPFATWVKVKALNQQKATASKTAASEPTSPFLADETSTFERRGNFPLTESTVPRLKSLPLFDKSGSLLRKPFDEVDDKLAPEQQDLQSEHIVWVDPITRIRSLVDRRTGFMVKADKDTRKRQKALPVQGVIGTSGAGANTKLGSRQKGPGLEEALSIWENPAFAPVETHIPRVPEISDPLGHGHLGPAASHACRDLGGNGEINAEPLNGCISRTHQGRISKYALRKAEVIGQVNRKFILVKITAKTPDVTTREGISTTKSDETQPASNLGRQQLLVLVDQHAADERCRVEELMKTYFAPVANDSGTGSRRLVAQTQVPPKPLRFDLSRQDGELLTRFKGHFEHWGIFYEVFSSEMGDATSTLLGGERAMRVTVEVQSLPPSILERCRVEPRLLVELLRREIWKLHDGSSGRYVDEMAEVAEGGEGEADWVPRFHHCPEGVVDMINSRSCRSAIMFNDDLSIEQCSEIVQRLARCAFPFQCAHGRPSMVPLVDIGGSSGSVGTLGSACSIPGEQANVGLLAALKRLAVDVKKEKGEAIRGRDEVNIL